MNPVHWYLVLTLTVYVHSCFLITDLLNIVVKYSYHKSVDIEFVLLELKIGLLFSCLEAVPPSLDVLAEVKASILLMAADL